MIATSVFTEKAESQEGLAEGLKINGEHGRRIEEEPQLRTVSLEIVPERADTKVVHGRAHVFDSWMQAALDPEVDKKKREELEDRQRRHFELTFQQARKKWPWERIKQLEGEVETYKCLWDDLGPRIEEAISTVAGHREVN